MPVDTTKLKGLWEKVKDFFKNMSKKMRIILAAALAVVLIAIVVTVVLLSGKKEYVPLYQDLTPTEVSDILSYFQSNGITDYQATGTTIMVRSEQYPLLLAQLAQQGYPKDASLYGSYWSNVGALTTNSQGERAYLIAQQERLETTIRTFNGVLDADVYITPGEDRTYVLEDISTETTAAVHLTLRNNFILPDETAEAIRWLVSHAWSGMTIDSVSITDTMNNTYSGTESGASTSDVLELKRRLEESTSNRIRTEVKNVLDQLYGAENVSVAVGVTVDVSERYVDSVSYSQPEGSYESAGLIGHEMGTYALTRDGYQLVGGVPGTSTNADIPTYVRDEAQGVEDEDGWVSSFERDNKIDETREQIKVAPTISDISIAVTINADANTAANLDVEQLQNHVAKAGNIGGENPADRVSVLVAPFKTDPVPEPAPGLIPQEYVPYVIIAAAALLLIVVLLIVILSIRRKKKKQREEEDQRIIEEQLGELGADGLLGELGLTPQAVGEDGQPPAPTTGADIMEINTEKSMELRKNVRQFVQNNPEVAALMLKTWLKGGDDDNG